MYRHIVRELERRKRLGGDLDDEDDQLTSSSSDSSDGEHSDGEEAVPVKRVRQLKRGASAASSSDEEGSDGTSDSDSDDGTSNASDDDQSTEMHEDGTSEDGPKEDASVEEEVEEYAFSALPFTPLTLCIGRQSATSARFAPRRRSSTSKQCRRILAARCGHGSLSRRVTCR